MKANLTRYQTIEQHLRLKTHFGNSIFMLQPLICVCLQPKEITPTIEAILRERAVNSNWEFVFSRTGNSVTHYHKILSDAAKQCGLIYGKFKRGGFITHDARHTAITRMLQAGVDLSTVGSITGHSDASLVLHYSHATRESRRNAVSILENLVEGL